jgi:hypothetical protein
MLKDKTKKITFSHIGCVIPHINPFPVSELISGGLSAEDLKIPRENH